MTSPIPGALINAHSRPPSRPGTPGTHNQNPHTIQLTAAALMSGGSNSSPVASSTSTGAIPVRTPKALDNNNDFNFAVPSLPPRLANFGRKISQMGTDFINELDAPYVEPKQQPSKIPREEVPGMGDEPVMCPFCEKPLPPALFASHTHPKPPTRPTPLKRSNTTTGVKPALVRSSSTQATPGVRTSSATYAAPAPRRSLNSLPSTPPDPTSDAESLLASVTAGETSNIEAAKLVVKEDDLRRWFKAAGVIPPSPVKPKTTQERSIPRIDPPPGSSRAVPGRSSSRSSARFKLFKPDDESLKEDEESDDDNGGGNGYARLQAGGSDTEDEDTKELVHDEPKAIEDASLNEGGSVKDVDPVAASPDAPDHTPEVSTPPLDVSPDELRHVLKEVLRKVAEMNASHKSLLHSQTSLLTSLKIARSNLAMAEANTEMLEAQVKQATAQAAAQAASPATSPLPRATSPNTPASVARTIPLGMGTAPARRSEERQRPVSLHIPQNTLGPSSVPSEKSGWGFWKNESKRKMPGGFTLPSPSQIMNALPTPTMDDRTFDFGSSASSSVKSPEIKRVSSLSNESVGLQRSASYTGLPTSPPTRTGPVHPVASVSNVELENLKKQYRSAETRIESMTKELAELKKGKVEMEQELENLSQALFEEANKMVADERKKRAEVEESLKEVKEEREALRQTIKVLGGQVTEKEEVTPPEITVTPGDDLPEAFMPRDLDKHYEALRKSIHHVADGASHPFSPLSKHPEELGVPETVEEDREEISSGEASPPKRSSIIAPLDPNPWANPSPFSADASADMPGILPGEEKLREPVALESPGHVRD